MISLRSIGTGAALVILMALRTASADTMLFSNMDNIDGPFNTGHVWVVVGNAPPGNYENAWASSFSVAKMPRPPESTWRWPTLDPLRNRSMWASISSDPITGLPSTLISGTYLVNVPVGVSTPESVALSPLALTAGATYWVGVIPDSSSTSAYWFQNPNLSQQVAVFQRCWTALVELGLTVASAPLPQLAHILANSTW